MLCDLNGIYHVQLSSYFAALCALLHPHRRAAEQTVSIGPLAWRWCNSVPEQVTNVLLQPPCEKPPRILRQIASAIRGRVEVLGNSESFLASMCAQMAASGDSVPLRSLSAGPGSSTCSSRPRNQQTRLGCPRLLLLRVRPSQRAPTLPQLHNMGTAEIQIVPAVMRLVP